MIPSSLYPLVTALLSNILAQVLKTVVYYYRTGKWDLHWVIASGGFPSSHSSTVTALSLSIGIQHPGGSRRNSGSIEFVPIEILRTVDFGNLL